MGFGQRACTVTRYGYKTRLQGTVTGYGYKIRLHDAEVTRYGYKMRKIRLHDTVTRYGGFQDTVGFKIRLQETVTRYGRFQDTVSRYGYKIRSVSRYGFKIRFQDTVSRYGFKIRASPISVGLVEELGGRPRVDPVGGDFLQGREVPPLFSHSFVILTLFPMFYGILMRNHRVIIGNVVEGTLLPAGWPVSPAGLQGTVQSAPTPPVGSHYSCQPTVKLHMLPLVWIFPL